jgi:NRPS condensation-like uncharacterized protein
VGGELSPRSAQRELPRIPFAAVDEGILHLDSRDEPWSVHLEAGVDVAVDIARLRDALTTALARHPRARARLVTSRSWPRRYEWEVPAQPDVDPLDVVECADDAAVAAARADLQSRSVPLRTSPPLRVRLARHRGGDFVMLNVNHSASDGIGALTLLRAMASAYRGERVFEIPTLPGPARQTSSPRSLRERARRGWVLLGELRDVVAPSAHLVAEGGDDRPGYGFQQLALSPEQTSALGRLRGAGATVNDALLAALHLAIAGWNAERGVTSRRVSVLMPVNLRVGRAEPDAVGNFLFMVPVSTRREDRADPGRVLDAISRRTTRIKHGDVAAALLGVLDRLQPLPMPAKRAMAAALVQDRVVPSAILSNLGKLGEALDFGPDVGEATEVWFSPPARMPLGLAVGAVTVGARLRLSFRFRHPLMGADAAASFAARYVDTLDRLAALAHTKPRPSCR